MSKLSISIDKNNTTFVTTKATKNVIQPAILGIKGEPGERGPAGISNIIDIKEFVFESFDGQDEINFPEDQLYTPGKNSVFVYVDGNYLDKSKYIEFSPSLIKVITPLSANRHVVVKFIRYQDYENIDSSNGIIISDRKPVQNVYDGLLWFDMASGSLNVYNTITGFKQLSYKSDFAADDSIIFMDGGFF